MANNLSKILEMRQITKHFGGLLALDKVDFDLYQGEVLALIGDNGAGKSTLMKILTGVITADKGDIILDQKKVKINTPQDARRLGIGMVYQDLALVETLDASINVFLGNEKRKWRFFLDKRKMRQEAQKFMESMQVKLKSLGEPVINLSGGQRAAVSIARVLTFVPRIVILDEPTAPLDPVATERVLKLIKKLASEGMSIVVICHRFEDIFAIANRIIMLHQGKKLYQNKTKLLTADDLLNKMKDVRSSYIES